MTSTHMDQAVLMRIVEVVEDIKTGAKTNSYKYIRKKNPNQDRIHDTTNENQEPAVTQAKSSHSLSETLSRNPSDVSVASDRCLRPCPPPAIGGMGTNRKSEGVSTLSHR